MEKLKAGLVSQGELSQGGSRTSKVDVHQGVGRGGYGAAQHPIRGNNRGGRGGHTSSPGHKQQNTKNLAPHGSIRGTSVPRG